LQAADDHDVVNINGDEDTICLAKSAAEEKAGGCNRGLDSELIDNKVVDFLKILSVSLLDAIEGFIQIDLWSASAIRIRPVTFWKTHVECLI
jgi:hypothetical protein